jgi:hypothetical protein
MTADGSVPDPPVDNGWDSGLNSNRRLMSLPLSYYAGRLLPLPNADAGCSNTGLRRRQEAPGF